MKNDYVLNKRDVCQLYIERNKDVTDVTFVTFTYIEFT